MEHRRTERYLAAGGVVVHDNQVLVLRRPHRAEVRLPKGHVEPGEDAAEAAIRETQEESGYQDVRQEGMPRPELTDDARRTRQPQLLVHRDGGAAVAPFGHGLDFTRRDCAGPPTRRGGPRRPTRRGRGARRGKRDPSRSAGG